MRGATAICVILFLLGSCDTATNDIAVDDKVFFKFYGGEYIEEGLDVVQALDNGYVIVGTTTSTSAGENKNILIVKTDSRGNTQWIKTIGGEGDDIARKVKRLPNGGFMVIGDVSIIEDEISYKEIIMIRFDGLGNELWRNTYGYRRGLVNYDVEGMDVAINGDGNFLVVGNITFNNLDSEILFFVTDGNGVQIGESTLIGQENTIEHAKSVLPDPTGNNLAFIVGYTNYSESQGQDGYNMFLININKDGSVPFPNIIGGANDEFGEMMVLTNDNKLMVLGSEIRGSSSKIQLRKVNLNLDTEWMVNLDVDGMEYLKGTGISKTRDGYVIVAEWKISGINSKIALIKVDVSGNMLWNRSVRIFGGEFFDKANAVISDDQENIIITGQSAFTALGSNAKMCLIKTRHDGKLKP
jgi:hypothetical protein